MTFYRKLPVVIEAVRWTGENYLEINTHCGPDAEFVGPHNEVLYIKTLEGKLLASKGDFIIKGVNGEHCPCKPDIFMKTYEIYEPMKIEDDFLSEDYNLYTRPYRVDRE